MTSVGSDCLRDEDVLLLLGGGGKELDSLRAHLNSCDVCQELVALASSAPDVPIRVGDTILDRYRVLDEVGRGGMGIVYRVHDPKLHRELAIKILHSADPSAPLRLEREARALARLSHPNIVTVFDTGGLREQVCMVMELVDGSSLRAWLEKERSREEILRVFRQAAEGLHAAHQAGLVHRDFKPENVLVSDSGRVKVVDFGLAAADLVTTFTEAPAASTLAYSSMLHRLTRTGRAVGTPAYMAPEQLRGMEADARSDQFAFAVCLWEALHGEHPFHAATLGELRRNIERGPGGNLGTRRRDRVTDALRRALSIDPETRFASMDALLRALDSASHSRPRGRSMGVALVAAAVAASAVIVVGARGSRASSLLDGAQSVTLRSAEIPTAPASSSIASPPPELSSTAPASSIVDSAGARTAPAPTPTAIRQRPSAPKPRLTSASASSSTSNPIPPRGPNGAPLIE